MGPASAHAATRLATQRDTACTHPPLEGEEPAPDLIGGRTPSGAQRSEGGRGGVSFEARLRRAPQDDVPTESVIVRSERSEPRTITPPRLPPAQGRGRRPSPSRGGWERAAPHALMLLATLCSLFATRCSLLHLPPLRHRADGVAADDGRAVHLPQHDLAGVVLPQEVGVAVAVVVAAVDDVPMVGAPAAFSCAAAARSKRSIAVWIVFVPSPGRRGGRICLRCLSVVVARLDRAI
jgi:hypothetical protein